MWWVLLTSLQRMGAEADVALRVCGGWWLLELGPLPTSAGGDHTVQWVPELERDPRELKFWIPPLSAWQHHHRHDCPGMDVGYGPGRVWECLINTKRAFYINVVTTVNIRSFGSTRIPLKIWTSFPLITWHAVYNFPKSFFFFLKHEDYG